MNPITSRATQTDAAERREDVRDYYGRVLESKRDLRTSACCTTDALSAEHRAILADIEDEILEKFYGCGSPLPPLLDGCTVLDLGCGTGRDAYLASKLVGPEGRVIGVDMTEAQLAVAEKHVRTQTRRFGDDTPNVSFRHGYIEDLGDAGIVDDSVDVVISNCVLNLSPDKRAVFSEIFRVLKPGGELYFSDVFAGRRVPAGLRDDPLLYGECLAGAMYTEDFRRLLRDTGVPDHRVVEASPIAIEDPEVEAKIGMVDFHSLTVRAFKLASLEDICEDYGQTAIYRGSVPGSPHRFVLDDHHEFVTGKPMLVCGNTAAMLGETRFSRHFRIIGDRRTHFGAFDCAPAASKAQDGTGSGGACC
jgi:SAM-dependent methyltransferase